MRSTALSFRRFLLFSCLAMSASSALALHIVPDHLGDVHFTSGPCPDIAPKDGAACPNGASTCPAFYSPNLLPGGYNSVSYCAQVPVGIGFSAPGLGLLTRALDVKEQEAFLKAAQKVESYVMDDVTVVVEPYKAAYIDASGNNNLLFLGNEYWNPVCAVDALLPPFSRQAPTVVQNSDGSFSYQGLPETYTTVVRALKRKNAENHQPMDLINYLPDHDQINVEWPATFFGWQANSNLSANRISNYLVGPSNNYPITPGAKPFTLCAAPAAMKMLGLAPFFLRNGHTLNDLNSPQVNMNVTLAGTDGAIVIPDLTNTPQAYVPPYTWIYDSTSKDVVATQLPKAYLEKSLNLYLPQVSCADPTQCQFPQGVNGGSDLIGIFNHEINHVLGIMQSQYYKVGSNQNALAYTYGTALYLLDLFDLDSDYVVAGFGHRGIQSMADFTSVPRNNDPYGPTSVVFATTPSALTPWVQFGLRDHVMVYDVNSSSPDYFPLMNESVVNPDGDIQYQAGYVSTQGGTALRITYVDPLLVGLPPMAVVHYNVQFGGDASTIDVDTIREYSELAANGWDVDYSTLADPYHTISPLANWYRACFDSNGVFTTAKNKNCKFSVLPKDLEFLQ